MCFAERSQNAYAHIIHAYICPYTPTVRHYGHHISSSGDFVYLFGMCTAAAVLQLNSNTKCCPTAASQRRLSVCLFLNRWPCRVRFTEIHFRHCRATSAALRDDDGPGSPLVVAPCKLVKHISFLPIPISPLHTHTH